MSEFPIAKLCDVAEIVMGTSPPGDLCNTVGIGTPLLNGPTEFGSRYPTPVQYTAEGSRFAEEGDLLFCVRGSTTGRMNWADQDYAIGRGLAALRHKHGSGYQPFVFAAVSVALADLLAAATGSTFPSVSKSQLHDLPIPLPPLPEQRAIADILGALDDKIDLNRRMNETLEAMARALFKSWFVDFDPVRAKMEGRQPFGMDQATADLFPDRLVESEIGLIPEGWEVSSIYQIASVTYGAPFKSRDFLDAAAGFPVIRIRDLKTMAPQISTLEEHPKASVVEPGDLLVGMDGDFDAVFWLGNRGWLNQRVCMLRPTASVSPDFVRYSIKPHLVFLERTKIGTTVIHLGKKDIDGFEQICPDASVHEAFGDLTNSLHAERVRLAAESRTLAELRDLLLPKLLSGEIRVADAEKEVEAAL